MSEFRPTRFRARAFTLIELLVVIAIILVLAALVVPLAGFTGDKKAISTTRAEIDRLSTLIEIYKQKNGFYPPEPNIAGLEPTNSSLFYELISMTLHNNGTFSNGAFDITVKDTDLMTVCGVPTVFNAISNASSADIEDRKVRAYSFLREVSSRQTNTITVNGRSAIVFVAPIEGPNGRSVNPLFYRVGNDANGTHNATAFDLWAEIKTRKGPRIIGNWKD